MLSQIGSNLDFRLMAVTMEIYEIFSWYGAQTMGCSYRWWTQVWNLSCAAHREQTLKKPHKYPCYGELPACDVHLVCEPAGAGEWLQLLQAFLSCRHSALIPLEEMNRFPRNKSQSEELGGSGHSLSCSVWDLQIPNPGCERSFTKWKLRLGVDSGDGGSQHKEQAQVWGSDVLWAVSWSLQGNWSWSFPCCRCPVGGMVPAFLGTAGL